MYAKEENGKYAFFPSDSGKTETMTDPPCALHIVESTIIKENG